MNNANIIENKTHWKVDVLTSRERVITRQSMSHKNFNEKGIEIDKVLTGPYEPGTNREFYCIRHVSKPKGRR